MPSPYDPPTDPATGGPLILYTLDYWIQNIPDPLTALNTAIEWSGANRIPVYITKSYGLAPGLNTRQVILKSYATIICSPGCTLTWTPDNTNPPLFGIITSDPAGLTAVRWSGGRFVGAGGTVPSGDFFNLVGSDLILKNVTVENCTGYACWLNGDNIRLINPAVVNSSAASSKGVAFTGGERFRLTDGTITARTTY